MNAADLIAALVETLAGAYPTKLADRANLPGRVCCVVEPVSGDYEDTHCGPLPVEVTAEVRVVAAMTGERGVADLLGHLDPVAELVRLAGWTPARWTADNIDETPALVITATAFGHG